MCSLPTAIQRLQVPLQSAVDPLYAYGRAWHRRGFSLPPEKHEQLLSGSLGELINHFRRCGLCEDPAYGQSSGAGYAGLAQMPVMTRESLRALFPRGADSRSNQESADEYICLSANDPRSGSVGIYAP